MLSICLFSTTSELTYAYKLYAYKKECNMCTKKHQKYVNDIF